MQTHVKVLGVVYLAFGACMLLGALFLVLTMGSVAGIVGATAEPRDAAVAIPILGLAGTEIVLLKKSDQVSAFRAVIPSRNHSLLAELMLHVQ